MGSQDTPDNRAYVRALAEEARRLQREARSALEQGEFTRASALIGKAELLAEDVHNLVGDFERHEMDGLMALAAYDVRAKDKPPRKRFRLSLPSRRARIALGTSIAASLALTEC